MGRDYYNTLGITKSASTADVQKAYRRLALKYHPEKNEDPGAGEKSRDIAEAYDVLNDPSKRAIYDKFGEEGLKRGIPNEEGGFTEGYTFHGDVDRVFQEFFGGNNPFADFFHLENNVDVDGHATFGGLKGRARPKQDPPIERQLMLTLEEVYNGCTKKMKISRRVLNDDGHTTSTREKILTINVKKGWREGTRITFSKEGDQGPNKIPADIVFIITDQQHPLFHREGNDLVYQPQIPLVTALTGGAIDVPTLDGRQIRVPITEVISPGQEKRVVGEGMTLVEDPTQTGDLLVRFNVLFPPVLNPNQKSLIKQALN